MSTAMQRLEWALWVAIGCTAVVCGCRKHEQQQEQTFHPPPRGLPPIKAEPEPAAQKPAPPAPDPSLLLQPEADQKPASAAAPPGEAEKADEEAPKRDYSAELRELVGSPTGCLKPRAGPNAPASLSISVEAVVVDSGLITRAYVRSPELDDEELACVRARLTTARMRAPVDDAPRSVTATVTLTRQPAPAADAKPGDEGAQTRQGAAAEAPSAAPEAEVGAAAQGQPPENAPPAEPTTTEQPGE